jgi:hypothetical protein
LPLRTDTISDKSGVYKHCGLELVSSINCVFTDNIVDQGAHIGISISNNDPKEYVFWAYNMIHYCTTWAVQIQGDAGGAAYHYFYKNGFRYTYEDHPSALYGNQGHGFRFNDNCHYITLEYNDISSNGGAGVQPGGANLDQLSFFNNYIVGNNNESITADPGSDLEWVNNTVAGNGSNIQLSSRGFSNLKPTANFTVPSVVKLGDSVTFTNTSSDPDGSIGHVLRDLNHGLPSTETSPTYTYPKPSRYRVSLIVWDNADRGARRERTIAVVSEPTVTGLTIDNDTISLSVGNLAAVASNTVERCSNLLSNDWQTVETFVSANGQTNWSEAISGSKTQAFYRIRSF